MLIDVSLILSFIAGFCAALVANEALKRLALRIVRQQANQKGREAQISYNSRLEAAVIEAVGLYKEGKKPVEIGKELLPKYPDVALSLGKKAVKALKTGDVEEITGDLFGKTEG